MPRPSAGGGASTRNTTATSGTRASIRPGVRNPTVSSLAAGGPGGAGSRTSRHASLMASRIDRTAGAASPADSLISSATLSSNKRKERDFDPEDGGEATNINVFVRCRGRNEREVKENSAVAVKTDGVKGKLVELNMGPNAVSNKTYNFDRVFSQAADQVMIFDEVVKPILDEMLAGYNCTIFAYGQTGTGKTYTMSGDMTDTMGMLPDTAGIIPRVLHALFKKLDVEETDSCVRCSFIELYNEELRDLLSADDNAKLKIYENNPQKGHFATVVQGMEERHITSATDGLRWLQEGSVKRQVAATKCNDLSSRSHTVFTITIYAKRKTENGEDYLLAGKLNLVDLAGSENIQRSGAENKRAAEAGLINKSLLTLGRVINALVDRSSHIPYRESKLTRLLQDSLGGRTKTCIIATISPAKGNLEETISTLEYAFRAKNIRNKPQLNSLINKKTLLREFTTEIEKLKTELINTRQRNGVYLSNDAYEELTVQSESRRILTEEQSIKIDTLETNLRNKVQELFALMTSFSGLKKDHEGTQALLEETKGVLDQTEVVLKATRKSLAEETHIRRAHQVTEEKLSRVGGELISALKRTVSDVDGLRAKTRRKSDLHALNRSTWSMSQAQVSGITELVEGRIEEFRRGQEEHISNVSERMRDFVREELAKLSTTQNFLDENLSQFVAAKAQLVEQKQRSKEEMDEVLEEIKVVRDSVKERVGESLNAIAAAAERIAGDVLGELTTFHAQLHESYSSLGKDCKTAFDELMRHLAAQKAESDRLRQELEVASQTVVESNEAISARIQEVLDEERRQSAAERQKLLTQIASLINSQAEAQEERLASKAAAIKQSVAEASKTFEGSVAEFSQGMNAWSEKDGQVLEDVAKSRDSLKNKLKDDWAIANEHSSSIQKTTQSVHAETIRVVDEQMRDLDAQMRDLDDFVTRAKMQNATHHTRHAGSVKELSGTVEKSFANIAGHFKETFGRVESLGEEMEEDTDKILEGLGEPLDEGVCQPLASLRSDIQSTLLREYEPTGETPQKFNYNYPTELPRTQAHEKLIAEMNYDGDGSDDVTVVKHEADTDGDVEMTPSKPPAAADDVSEAPTPVAPTPVPAASAAMPSPAVFNDAPRSSPRLLPPSSPASGTPSAANRKMSLREVNPNITRDRESSIALELTTTITTTIPTATSDDTTSSIAKPVSGVRSTRSRHSTANSLAGGGSTASTATRSLKKRIATLTSGRAGSVAIPEGAENVPPLAVLAQGGRQRKSPRLN